MGKKRDENSRGYSYNPENIVLELKIYSESLNLRKIENKKWPKMYCEQKKKIDIKHTRSLKVLKRNIL